ncbi:unnamed protein product [Rangifer tarandus platyrhynchus]|uniref:Uncharacterized protein n=1 Tax=Rangifer tarandus platyrhynchus TaxID=3082113 RepID=A0ABN8Z1A8_RANTA|nr:unnamed protein product [Rangifer tarandus platyrhynchus]
MEQEGQNEAQALSVLAAPQAKACRSHRQCYGSPQATTQEDKLAPELLGPQCPPPNQGGCGRGHRGGGDGGQPLVISFSPKQTELEEFVHLHLPWASLKALQVKIWFPKQFQKQEKRCTEARVADTPWLRLLTHLRCLQTGPLCSAMLWL